MRFLPTQDILRFYDLAQGCLSCMPKQKTKISSFLLLLDCCPIYPTLFKGKNFFSLYMTVKKGTGRQEDLPCISPFPHHRGNLRFKIHCSSKLCPASITQPDRLLDKVCYMPTEYSLQSAMVDFTAELMLPFGTFNQQTKDPYKEVIFLVIFHS